MLLPELKHSKFLLIKFELYLVASCIACWGIKVTQHPCKWSYQEDPKILTLVVSRINLMISNINVKLKLLRYEY